MFSRLRSCTVRPGGLLCPRTTASYQSETEAGAQCPCSRSIGTQKCSITHQQPRQFRCTNVHNYIEQATIYHVAYVVSSPGALRLTFHTVFRRFGATRFMAYSVSGKCWLWCLYGCHLEWTVTAGKHIKIHSGQLYLFGPHGSKVRRATPFLFRAKHCIIGGGCNRMTHFSVAFRISEGVVTA